MSRKSTPTFTVEFPLDTSPADDRELRIRREAYRQIYNAILGESLKNLKLMRESKAYQAARKLPKGSDKDTRARDLRSEIFDGINKKYNFTSVCVEKFAVLCYRQAPHIGNHIESRGARSMARRAFEAVQKYAFGKVGKPKFKNYKEINSVESTEDSAIMLRKRKTDGRLVIKWNGLVLPVVLDLKNDWQIKALTEYKTKFVLNRHRAIYIIQNHGKI